MIRRLAICLVIASLTFVAPRPAAAAVTHSFDAVDAVEIGHLSSYQNSHFVIVTGILVGATVQTTHKFHFDGNPEQSTRCERFAVIAMSKPGKFRFSIGSITSTGGTGGGCKLTLRTP